MLNPLKKIAYFACVDMEKFPGVANKLNQTIAACCEIGYDAKLTVVRGGRISKYFRLASLIVNTDAQIIIIRNVLLLIICVPSMLYARLKKKVIIVDIPTPINAVVCEIYGRSSSLMDFIKSRVNYLLFPFSLWPASKILQYADEAWWFRIGINNKIKYVSNGISVKAVPARSLPRISGKKKLILVGAASLADWHGYDRVIRGIKYYYSQPNIEYCVHFIIAGEGTEKSNLEKLVNELNMRDYIEFVGHQSTSELNNIFNIAHVGVSSLGLYRKNLRSASDLKSREYCARGIPFIAAGDDPDFDDKILFVKKFQNDNSSISIEKIIAWYEKLDFNDCTIEIIRNYANQKLDLKGKMEIILSD